MQAMAGTHRWTTRWGPTYVGRVASAFLVAGAAVAVLSPSAVTGAVFAIVAAFALAVVGAWIDLRERRIPDVVVVGVAGVVAGVVAAESVGGYGSTPLTSAAAGAVLFALPLFVAHSISPGALGFGDVKLGMALGAVLGLVDWRAGLLALCVASGATAAIGLVRRATHLPFGPGLVAGSAVALLVSLVDGGTVLPWR